MNDLLAYLTQNCCRDDAPGSNTEDVAPAARCCP
jgi:hypothetical protein